AGFSLANGLYGLLVLPESLPKDKRTATFSLAKANPLGALTLLRSHHELFGLAGASGLNHFAHAVLPTITGLFLTPRYAWRHDMIGVCMALIGLCSMIVQGGLIGRTVARFGERATLYAGLIFGVAGFSMFGLAPTGMWFLIGVPVLALWGFAGAAALAL